MHSHSDLGSVVAPYLGSSHTHTPSHMGSKQPLSSSLPPSLPLPIQLPLSMAQGLPKPRPGMLRAQQELADALLLAELQGGPLFGLQQNAGQHQNLGLLEPCNLRLQSLRQQQQNFGQEQELARDRRLESPLSVDMGASTEGSSSSAAAAAALASHGYALCSELSADNHASPGSVSHCNAGAWGQQQQAGRPNGQGAKAQAVADAVPSPFGNNSSKGNNLPMVFAFTGSFASQALASILLDSPSSSPKLMSELQQTLEGSCSFQPGSGHSLPRLEASKESFQIPSETSFSAAQRAGGTGKLPGAFPPSLLVSLHSDCRSDTGPPAPESVGSQPSELRRLHGASPDADAIADVMPGAPAPAGARTTPATGDAAAAASGMGLCPRVAVGSKRGASHDASGAPSTPLPLAEEEGSAHKLLRLLEGNSGVYSPGTPNSSSGTAGFPADPHVHPAGPSSGPPSMPPSVAGAGQGGEGDGGAEMEAVGVPGVCPGTSSGSGDLTLDSLVLLQALLGLPDAGLGRQESVAKNDLLLPAWQGVQSGNGCETENADAQASPSPANGAFGTENLHTGELFQDHQQPQQQRHEQEQGPVRQLQQRLLDCSTATQSHGPPKASSPSRPMGPISEGTDGAPALPQVSTSGAPGDTLRELVRQGSQGNALLLPGQLNGQLNGQAEVEGEGEDELFLGAFEEGGKEPKVQRKKGSHFGPERRKIRVASEKERRQRIREGLQLLRDTINGSGDSSAMLQQAVAYIKSLEEEVQTLRTKEGAGAKVEEEA